ncbi:exodeoxyribonuclease V subunit beta [Neisseria sp. 83E34]|uniref:exodeoxyribonuclease V subunit beta n=1 Tax=Neisseria sp. 83E34 TaxID=1692264 RepID=UPI0006CEA980|nr:exodeoxyribonuclease V subunit beta [Neisseria sp. 83E34]KPN71284.1 exodeoxyribonuclease V subunit beta [Neisseria sp. 83E34]
MQPSVAAFDPFTIPIQGTNLIEASAGTGKTFGIAALFTRLVLLEKMPVESILVVTFTKAATAELKTRLRSRLDEALRWLEKPDDQKPSIDDFLQNLLDKALNQETEALLILRLKAAISQFDNAAIYTIHGFCQRLLRDYAFFCQVPFDMELETDGNERLLIAAQDFWRERVAHDAVAARLVFGHNLTPESELAKMRTYIGRPLLQYAKNEVDLAEREVELSKAWAKVYAGLTELEVIFEQVHSVINKRTFAPKSMQDLFAALKQDAANQCLSEKNELYRKHLPKFDLETLKGNVNKGKTLVANADKLNLLANLGRVIVAKQAAEQAAVAALQLDFLDYIKAAVAQLKETQRERGYDDLLLDVYAALNENSLYSKALAEMVANTWQVALIDEFQDTDPLQYGIFQKTFIRHGNPLFLVGDPKQAIYSFRGADIHAYLQAADDADHHYTLTQNYRSHNQLIKSISLFFQQKKQPFVLKGIGYTDVSAARADACLKPLDHALRVRWLNGDDEAALNKEVLRSRAAEYCADEIAAMLNRAAEGGLNLKARPLQTGDIAVLVRTRNEGSMVGAALKARGIQSVLLQRHSVFAEKEARAVAALLAFWLRPQETEALRFVLGSVLFGQTAEQLYALNQNEHQLLDYIDAAQTALATWQKHGIYAAMQQFAARYDLEGGLLSARNERSLTNYHQIIELLAEEDERSRSPESLHQWLKVQISEAQNGKEAGENKILRLESDEALVKIVTMHASKGLQYPVVFCPFVWDAADYKTEDWQVINRETGSELVSALELTDEDKNALADEELGERLRLLYVAMTRAEEQLTIYAAYFNGSARNTFAYLLEGSEEATRAEIEAGYAAEKKANKAEGEKNMLLKNWLRLIENAPENTDIVWLQGAPETAASQSQTYSENGFQAWAPTVRAFEHIRHTSFTGLLRDLSAAAAPEREELQPAVDAAEAGLAQSGLAESLSENMAVSDDVYDIYHFPRGTHAGVCLHELLEHFEFSRPASEQQAQIAETLARYGFGEEWLSAVCIMLDNAARAELFNHLALADLPEQNRLPEMDFMLKVEDFSPARLQAWFARPNLALPPSCLAAARHLDFDTVKGFLSGFIDMTCIDGEGNVCVIDYKSNYLGAEQQAYTQEAMDEAMAAHHYYLQAMIYAVAVARYLQQQNAGFNSICVRYLFLRGLDGEDGGVWRWQLERADLQEWL